MSFLKFDRHADHHILDEFQRYCQSIHSKEIDDDSWDNEVHRHSNWFEKLTMTKFPPNFPFSKRMMMSNTPVGISKIDTTLLGSSAIWSMWKISVDNNDADKLLRQVIVALVMSVMYVSMSILAPIITVSIAIQSSLEDANDYSFVHFAAIMFIGLLLFPSLGYLLLAHSNMNVCYFVNAIRLRWASSLYEEILKSPTAFNSERSRSSTLMDLIQDFDKILGCFQCVPRLASEVIAIVGALTIIYVELDFISVLSLVAYIAIAMILFHLITAKLFYAKPRTSYQGNVRSQHLLSMMRLYGWESVITRQYLDKMKEISRTEQMTESINDSTFLWLILANPILGLIVVLVVYISQSKTLSLSQAFSVLLSVSVMQHSMYYLASCWDRLVLGEAAAKKIITVMKRSADYSDIKQIDCDSLSGKDHAVVFRNATCSWSKVHDQTESESAGIDNNSSKISRYSTFCSPVVTRNASGDIEQETTGLLEGDRMEVNQPNNFFTLQNLNVTIKKGKLVAILGNRGSGKSSFLASILREMPAISGSVTLHCAKRYYANLQSPWLMQGTVRDNMALFSSHRESNYLKNENVVNEIESVGLDRSMNCNLDACIDSPTSNLSISQKAKLCVAQGIYSQAELVLFDDFFSGASNCWDFELFDAALIEQMTNRTRIIVVNGSHPALNDRVLSRCDQIIVLKKHLPHATSTTSGVVFDGSYDDYINSNIGTELHNGNDLSESTTAAMSESILPSNLLNSQENSPIPTSKENYWLQCWTYLSLGGVTQGIIALLLFAVSEACLAIATFYLADWTSIESSESTFHFLLIFAILQMISLTFFWFGRLVWISHYHTARLAIVRYFLCPEVDSNAAPISLSRTRGAENDEVMSTIISNNTDSTTYSSDTSAGIVYAVFVVFKILSVSTVIVIATKGLILFVIVPLILYQYFNVIIPFLSKALELQTLESTVKYALLKHIDETWQGSRSIRCLSLLTIESHFMKKFDNLLSRNYCVSVVIHGTRQWTLLRVNILSSVIEFVTGMILYWVIVNASSSSCYFAMSLYYGLQWSFFQRALLWLSQRVEESTNDSQSIHSLIKFYQNAVARCSNNGIHDGDSLLIGAQRMNKRTPSISRNEVQRNRLNLCQFVDDHEVLPATAQEIDEEDDIESDHRRVEEFIHWRNASSSEAPLRRVIVTNAKPCPVLEFRDVTAISRGSRLLDTVSFEIQPSEFVGIVGRSG